MKRFLWYAVIAIVLECVIMTVPAALALEQTDAESAIAALNETWTGVWVNTIGHVYHAEMHLTVASDGTVSGYITWTLKESPRDEEQSKLGFTAVEYVAGTYDKASRVLSFNGDKKADPDNVIGLDQYKLLLAENNNVVGGITCNHGDWLGLFSLTRGEAGKK